MKANRARRHTPSIRQATETQQAIWPSSAPKASNHANPRHWRHLACGRLLTARPRCTDRIFYRCNKPTSNSIKTITYNDRAPKGSQRAHRLQLPTIENKEAATKRQAMPIAFASRQAIESWPARTLDAELFAPQEKLLAAPEAACTRAQTLKQQQPQTGPPKPGMQPWRRGWAGPAFRRAPHASVGKAGAFGGRCLTGAARSDAQGVRPPPAWTRKMRKQARRAGTAHPRRHGVFAEKLCANASHQIARSV